jgi:hypothetical protein
MRISVILLSLVSCFAHGKVLIPSVEVEDQEYKALLRLRPEEMSPSQKILRLHPSRGNRAHLLNALARAQRAFVSQSTETAHTQFLEIVELIDKDDWQIEDRSIFAYALLRLAQLEPKSTVWLEQAASLGADVTVERSLFPPPLLAELELKRRNLKKVVLDDGLFRDWPLLLIGGRTCTKGSCPVEVGDGRIRVTWLSDKFQPHTSMMRARELLGYKPPQTPWFEGACGQETRFSEQARFLGDAEPFFGFNCGSAMTRPFRPNPASDLLIPEPPKPTAAFYKSKWLWAGVGAVVTAVLIASQNKRKTERESTTTYGY